MSVKSEKKQTEEGLRILLRGQEVGYWRGAPALGAALVPGQSIGFVETLGKRHPLSVPKGVGGVVVKRHIESARHPVDFGALLLELDPESVAGATGEEDATEAALGGESFASPMSGRFYARPAPDEPTFVSVGTEVKEGDTLCLLEVMKTFNRITYGGPGLPARARITAIVAEDGGDVDRGQPLFALEAL